MEQVVPWRELCALIEPHYPKAGNGRPPVGVERMLRIYFLQQWFNLSDPAVEEALYDSLVMRQFVGIDLGQEPVPDETTVCKFRHLLEEHRLGGQMLETVNLHLQSKECASRPARSWTPPSFMRPARRRTGSRSATRRCTRRKGQPVVLRDEGARGRGQQDEDHPHGRGHGGPCGRRDGAAGVVAWGRDAGLGRPGLSRTDRGDSRVRAAGAGLHPPRYRYKDRVDEVERAKNRTKSRVRSKVEHVFG